MFSFNFYKKIMIGYISIVVFIHSAVSALRWRKYLQHNMEDPFLPIDIIIEIVLGCLLATIAILSNTRKFKKLTEFKQIISFDSSFNRPNFKNYRNSRAKLLLPSVKEKLNTDNFDLAIKI